MTIVFKKWEKTEEKFWNLRENNNTFKYFRWENFCIYATMVVQFFFFLNILRSKDGKKLITAFVPLVIDVSSDL